MSAPDTNVEKQAKRHRGPIIGMALLLTFVAVLLVGYLFYVSTPVDDTPDNTPTGEAAVTDGNETIQTEDAVTQPGAPVLPDAGTEPTESPRE